MKKIILLSVFVIAFFTVQAQSPIFVKGDKVVNVGIGIDSYANISLSGEYGILDGIADKGSVGVGAYAGYGFGLLSGVYTHSSRVVAGLRGTFHYPFIEKLDTYGGIGMGLAFRHWKYDYTFLDDDDYTSNDVNLNAGFFLGARYYLTNKLAAFAEVGYGIGYITAGISFKL